MTQIVSSISGIEIYAPSAGNAPTNSSDVSAIASGYQVVSATATQLYAGTAFLTGVNSAPVSASRAGNAANASMANSAYYDGTGRLISSLPDSAVVSSIASSYAESAASSKADSSALSSYALSADVSGCIDTVSSNSASWGGGGATVPIEIKTGTTLKAVVTTGFQDNTATRPTLFISSNPAQTAYPRMMLSENHTNTSQGKSAAFLADAFEFYTGSGTKVMRVDAGAISGAFTGVGGSRFALKSAAVSGGSGTASWQYGSAEYNKLTSVHDTVSANSATWGGGGVDSATVSSIASSYAESAASSKLDSSASSSFYTTANESGFITGVDLSDYATTVYVDSSVSGKADTSSLTAYQPVGDYYSATNPSGFITGVDLSPYQEKSAMTAYQLSGDYAYNSSLSGYIPTSESSKYVTSLAGYATEEYVESSVSGKLDSTAFNSGDFYSTSNPSGFITGVDLTPYQEKSGMTSYQPVGEYYSASNPSGFITGVDLSNYATTGYVDSSVSSKANSSALSSYALSSDVSAVVNKVTGSSGYWDSAVTKLNNSGDSWNSAYNTVSTNSASWGQGGDVYISGFGYNDTDISAIEGSALYDKSAHSRITTVAGRVTNLSAAVSGTVDLVSTQSANWGGSALALSAGPGVKLEKVGDTLVVGADETVLWEGAGTSACTLSENCMNFERIKILYGISGGTGLGDGRWIETYPGVKYLDFTRAKGISNVHITWVSMSVQPTTITVSATRTMSFGLYTATSWSDPTIIVNNGEDRNALYKVVGINRTAGA